MQYFFTLFFIKCTIVTVYITTMKRYCIVIITAIALVLNTIACYKQHIPSDGVYTVWVHSDIQPTKKSERWHYTRAIDDIVNIKPHPIFAIIAGDIVQHKEAEEDYQWFIELRKKANISYWYEIAGNHEWKNMPAYNTYIGKPLRYTVLFGNIIFIFMSNERGRPPTYISDETFLWWKNIVITNQDKNIITVTHAPLKNSNLIGTVSKKHIIINSERFEKVLQQYHVDIWISAHIHLPAWIGQNSKIIPEFNNTLFINVYGIRKDPATNVESRIFFFTHGSKKVLIRLRDHEAETYKSTYDINHKLHYPFTCNNCLPEMIQ